MYECVKETLTLLTTTGRHTLSSPNSKKQQTLEIFFFFFCLHLNPQKFLIILSSIHLFLKTCLLGLNFPPLSRNSMYWSIDNFHPHKTYLMDLYLVGYLMCMWLSSSRVLGGYPIWWWVATIPTFCITFSSSTGGECWSVIIFQRAVNTEHFQLTAWKKASRLSPKNLNLSHWRDGNASLSFSSLPCSARLHLCWMFKIGCFWSSECCEIDAACLS